MKFARRHLLAICVAIIGFGCFAAFSWAEYGYFCDQASSHHQKCEGFWSDAHVHDWVYNATSNYQSELLFGVFLVVVLHKLAGDRDAEKDET